MHVAAAAASPSGVATLHGAAVAETVSTTGVPSAQLSVIALAIAIPMVMAASVFMCMFGRQPKSPEAKQAKERAIASSSQPAPAVELQQQAPAQLLTLQVSIPTSTLMEDTSVDQKRSFDAKNTDFANVPPPPLPTSFANGHVAAPAPANSTTLARGVARNTEVEDPTIDPALLAQLLHSTLHYRHYGTSPLSSEAPGSAAASAVSASASASEVTSTDPAASSLIGKSGAIAASPLGPLNSPSASSLARRNTPPLSPMAAASLSMILPDKTALIRGNFDVPGIPNTREVPPLVSYGARQLLADWEGLFRSVRSACGTVVGGAAVAPADSPAQDLASAEHPDAVRALQLTGSVARAVASMWRTLTTRTAAERVWTPIIYEHHVEYKHLSRAHRMRPAEMFLAIHELLYDLRAGDVVRDAIEPMLAACSADVRIALAAARASTVARAASTKSGETGSADAEDEEDEVEAAAAAAAADTLVSELPWAAAALMIRAKRYRPSLALVEVTGTGGRPDEKWMDILNASAVFLSGRVLQRSAGIDSSFASLDDIGAGMSTLDPMTIVSDFVWPGVFDLEESKVRIRARVLVRV
ncbi:hypothetical protein GGF31_003190 [Allomyces arbusculus]|nr:hypothetical protein GGF31_003190 [Allomyces arbusculus]